MKIKFLLCLWAVIAITGPLALLMQFAPQHAPLAGNFNVTGGGSYRLFASIGSSQTTMTLSSFKEPVSNIPYTMSYLNSDIEYGTIDPNSTSISEFVSFTGISQNSDGTATLTGVVRGLARTPGSGGCVASSTLAQAHSGQAIFILSNSPCFQSEYVPLRTVATSSAILVFASTTPPRLDSDPGASNYNAFPTTVFVTMAQLARTALAGTVNATALVNGVVQLATARQAASSTVTGSSGANDVIGSSYATDTPNTLTRGSVVPMTTIQGFLTQTWLDFSQVFTFTGGIVSNASTTIACASGKTLTLNALAYVCPSSQAAGVLKNDGSGNLSWGSPRYTLAGAAGISLGVSAFGTSSVQFALPASTLSASSTIEIYGSGVINESGAGTGTVFIRTSTGVTLAQFTPSTGGAAVNSYNFHAIITGTSTTASEQTYVTGTQISNTSGSTNLATFDVLTADNVNLATGPTLTVVLKSDANTNSFTLTNLQYIVSP